MPVSDFALATLGAIKQRLKLGSLASASRDAWLIDQLNGVTTEIETFCKRRIVARDYLQDLDGTGHAELYLENRPLLNVATLIDHHGDILRGFTASDVIKAKDRGFYKDSGTVRVWDDEGAFTKGRQSVRIDYHAGFAILDVEWGTQKFEFREKSAGTVYTVSIPPGEYDVFSLASRTQREMNTAGLNSHQVVYDTKNRTYTFKTTSANTLELLFNTGTTVAEPAPPVFGFSTAANLTGATSYTCATAVSPRVPYDLKQAALDIVSIRYTQSNWGEGRIDLKSERIGDYSVSFFGTQITKSTESVLKRYKRRLIASY